MIANKQLLNVRTNPHGHQRSSRLFRLRTRAQNWENPPETSGQVVAWAQQQFLLEVSRGRPDASISLAKVCLLLALDEEARQQLESAPSTVARTGATASTWSLSRLDALAAEVVAALEQTDLHTPDPHQHSTTDPSSSSNSRDSTGTSTSGAASDGQHDGSSSSNAQPGKSPVVVPAGGSAVVHQLALQFPMQVLQAVNTVLFQRHGYTACNRFGASCDSQLAVVMEDGAGSCAALTILYLEVCSRLGMSLAFKVLDEGRYCVVWPVASISQQQEQQQLCSHHDQLHHSTPAQQQAAEPTAPCSPQQHQQPPPQPQPQQQQQRSLLSVGGEACVVDVYGEGALLTVKEVTELFAISEEQLLAGSSKRELVACLLAEQQAAHWCAAVGCSPTPVLRTPLSAGTAVRQGVRQLHGAAIEKAAAAAEKRVVLMQEDQQAQLEFALLCYFSGRYEDAYLELGSYLERLKAAEQAQEQGQQRQEQQGRPTDTGSGQPAAGVEPEHESGPGSSSGSTSSSSSGSKVTELHAAVQSMLIGGALQPPVPSPVSPAAAAEAALASPDKDDQDAQIGKKQSQEMGDIVLLYQKLQLELMVANGQQ